MKAPCTYPDEQPPGSDLLSALGFSTSSNTVTTSWTAGPAAPGEIEASLTRAFERVMAAGPIQVAPTPPPEPPSADEILAAIRRVIAETPTLVVRPEHEAAAAEAALQGRLPFRISVSPYVPEGRAYLISPPGPPTAIRLDRPWLP